MNKILLLPLLIGFTLNGRTQNVGIGTTTPNGSAQLDISSTARGILIPRMTSAAITAITSPAKGLMVYDSTKNQLLVNMGSASTPDWENIIATSGWGLSGSSGAGGNFIGTTDENPLVFKVDNQPAGLLDSLNQNTAFGPGVQRNSTSATGSTSIGYMALLAGGPGNTAIGALCMGNNNSVGNGNSALGYAAMQNNTGMDNVGVGVDALFQNGGNSNIAVGTAALIANTSGFENTALGQEGLSSNQIGSENVAVGFRSLNQTTSSNFNTAVGYRSGAAFDNGFNNVFLGANCDVNGAGYFNVIAIGQSVVCTASSQARIGNSATNSIGGFADWTNFSDGRYKKDLKEDVKGIDFILRLRPITYHLDLTGIQNKIARGKVQTVDAATQKARAEKEATRFSGFSAQEVEQAAAAAGYDFSGVDKPKNENDFYGLRYGDFVVPLVKAVQEEHATIEAMNKRIAALEAQNKLLIQLLGNKN
jgi:hypothetical protein